MGDALVWYVAGEHEGMPQLFDTKEAAEKYARLLFPEESESKRYARIYFRRVATIKDLEGMPTNA